LSIHRLNDLAGTEKPEDTRKIARLYLQKSTEIVKRKNFPPDFFRIYLRANVNRIVFC